MKKQIIMNFSFSIYAIKISVLTLLILGCRETPKNKVSNETTNSNILESVDYDKDGLRVITKNLDLKNYIIQIIRKHEKLELDLNKLNIS